MSQLAALDTLTIESLVGVRPGVVFYLRTKGTSTSIHTYGREISFPSRVEEALKFTLGNRAFVVKHLPGKLDDSGRLALVRRLIREGLLYFPNLSV